jgi:hypothetical protein
MSEIKKLKFDPNKYYGHKEFYKILENLATLHSAKNFQYAKKGNPLSNFQRTGDLIQPLIKHGVSTDLAACMTLVAKQMTAVFDMVGDCKEGCVEQVEDKFRDIAVYSIIAMILLKESKEKKKDDKV